MKKFTIWVLFLFGMGALNAQIYMNVAATGSKTGKSWENAYTNLQQALDDTSAVNIWIAKGTYKAVGPEGDTTVFFKTTLLKNLYGGFAGTETTLAQRNPANNITILSADLKGDDKTDSLLVNKVDNRRHVLLIDSTVTSGTVILDGLTFEGGYTRNSIGISRALSRESFGGGVLSYAPITVQNCIFRGNYAVYGGGLACYGSTARNQTVTITNSRFEKNYNLATGVFGMAVYVFQAGTVSVDNCTFLQNQGNRAALNFDDCNNAVVDNCKFDKNLVTGGAAGGGFYAIRNKNVTVRRSDFTDNTATNTGATGIAMYFEVSSSTTDPSRNFNTDTTALNIIENCKFINNTSLASIAGVRFVGGSNVIIRNNEFNNNRANGNGIALSLAGNGHRIGRQNNMIVENNRFLSNSYTGTNVNATGGAVNLSDASLSINNCEFETNKGARGSAITVFGSTAQNILVNNSTFASNEGIGIGGAIYSQANTTALRIKNSTFAQNKSLTSGGALFVGFRSNTFVDSCKFLLNSGTFGGAIRFQNDTTVLEVRNSDFIGNTGTGSGGAISTASGEWSFVSVGNNFEGNTSGGFGGAMGLSGSSARILQAGKLFIDRCAFIANEATDQAGAINLSDRGGIIQNSIFASNTATGVGNGGAISHNNSDTIIVRTQDVNYNRSLLIVNNTFSKNTGTLISGLSVWADTSAKVKPVNVDFQNNIFDENIAIGVEAGTPKLISKGGNLYINDANKSFHSTQDFIETNFRFKDDAYNILTSSKAKNGGLVANAPTYDFKNLKRDAMPDIGALEDGATVSSLSAQYLTSFVVYPNPASDIISVTEDSGIQAGTRFTVFDISGKIVTTGHFDNRKSINVSALNIGDYFIRAYADKIYQTKFSVVK